MFIFFDVKVIEIKEIKLDGLLDGVQTIQNGNAVFGPAVRSISDVK